MFFSACQKQQTVLQPALVQTTTANVAYGTTAVTLSQATALALHFLQGKKPGDIVAVTSAETIVKNGKPYFHVINANDGFVIVSPDSLYVPVLAYNNTGNFSFAQKDINPGLAMWMNKHAHELDYVRDNKSAYIDSIGRVNKALWQAESPIAGNDGNAGHTTNPAGPNWPVFDGAPPTLISSVPYSNLTVVTVGPLCQTIWNEENPFNNDCPSDTNAIAGGYHDLVGCVPLAMGQVMYFWGIAHPASLSKYNWASMPLDGATAGLLPASNDCFKLLRDIGSTQLSTGQFVSYTELESSAQPIYIQQVFALFGFSGVLGAGDFSGTQFFSGPQDNTYGSFITSEVQNNKRPCLISGFPGENDILGIFSVSGQGHTWVCDGTDVTTFWIGVLNTYKSYTGVISTQIQYTQEIINPFLHMNWGYDGINDMWYDADVNYTQSAAGVTNYNYFQLIDYNIQIN